MTSSSSNNQRFPKSVRLRKRREYLAVQNRGRKYHLRHLLAFVLPGESRFGITVSGKVGNAVKRNRVKRLLREVIRRLRHGLPGGYDIVLIAKKNAVDATLAALRAQVDELGRRLARTHGQAETQSATRGGSGQGRPYRKGQAGNTD